MDTEVLFWDQQTLLAWLKKIGSPSSEIELFKTAKVDGKTWMYFNEAAMEAIGIKSQVRIAKLLGERERQRRAFAVKEGWISREELKKALDGLVADLVKKYGAPTSATP